VSGVSNPQALYPSFNGCDCTGWLPQCIVAVRPVCAPPSSLVPCAQQPQALKSTPSSALPAHMHTPPVLPAADRRFVYVTERYNADIVAIDLTAGGIEHPAAGALTAAPAGGSIYEAVGLCGVGRYLYASAHIVSP